MASVALSELQRPHPLVPEHPRVELARGVLFLVAYFQWAAGFFLRMSPPLGLHPLACVWAVPACWLVFSGLILGSFIDLDHFYLPDRVTIGGMNVKPSRPVKVGEVVDVKKPPVTYSFRVLKCIEQRVGAKLIPEVYENVTDPRQYEILEMSRISGFIDRARGTGRPTKKDRRQMDAFVEPAMFGFDDDDDEYEGSEANAKLEHTNNPLYLSEMQGIILFVIECQ